jgi:L-asparaginase / beta-aspartyl-peptidase
MLSKPPASHPTIPETRRGLALTLLTHTRNPSQLARALYLAPDLAPHTMLSGPEAESVGERLGIKSVDPSYYFTEHRWREHRRGLGLPEEPFPEGRVPSGTPFDNLDKFPTGTVGAVALDIRGCIASVTSTGGRTNKMVGRIGDTPQMGTGFWAEEWKDTSWFRKLLKKVMRSSTTKAVGLSGTGDGDVRFRLHMLLLSFSQPDVAVFHSPCYLFHHHPSRQVPE